MQNSDRIVSTDLVNKVGKRKRKKRKIARNFIAKNSLRFIFQFFKIYLCRKLTKATFRCVTNWSHMNSCEVVSITYLKNHLKKFFWISVNDIRSNKKRMPNKLWPKVKFALCETERWLLFHDIALGHETPARAVIRARIETFFMRNKRKYRPSGRSSASSPTEKMSCGLRVVQRVYQTGKHEISAEALQSDNSVLSTKSLFILLTSNMWILKGTRKQEDKQKRAKCHLHVATKFYLPFHPRQRVSICCT